MFGRIVVALFAVAGFAVAAEDKPDTVEAVYKKLQGTWTFESQEMGGMKVPADELKKRSLVFEGDKFAVKEGDKVLQAGTHKPDPAKKTVDATVTEGMGKGTVMLGLYELDGDTLKVCFDATGKARPTEFKAPEKSETFFNVHKRVKKEK